MLIPIERGSAEKKRRWHKEHHNEERKPSRLAKHEVHYTSLHFGSIPDISVSRNGGLREKPVAENSVYRDLAPGRLMPL